MPGSSCARSDAATSARHSSRPSRIRRNSSWPGWQHRADGGAARRDDAVVGREHARLREPQRPRPARVARCGVEPRLRGLLGGHVLVDLLRADRAAAPAAAARVRRSRAPRPAPLRPRRPTPAPAPGRPARSRSRTSPAPGRACTLSPTLTSTSVEAQAGRPRCRSRPPARRRCCRWRSACAASRPAAAVVTVTVSAGRAAGFASALPSPPPLPQPAAIIASSATPRIRTHAGLAERQRRFIAWSCRHAATGAVRFRGRPMPGCSRPAGRGCVPSPAPA